MSSAVRSDWVSVARGKGPSLYYERTYFPLLYVLKISLSSWVGGSKKPQNTLTIYKDIKYKDGP